MDNANNDKLFEPMNQTSNPNNYALNGKIMLSSVIVLFVAVLVIICFYSYAPSFFSRRRRRHLHHHQLSSSATANLASQGQGLDISILKSLPTFVYNSKTHDWLLECAVCLSEFRENEKGRVLPMCKHTFHIDCVDMWFKFHSNCPLCRSPVDNNSPDMPPETVLTVVEPTRLESVPDTKEEGVTV